MIWKIAQKEFLLNLVSARFIIGFLLCLFLIPFTVFEERPLSLVERFSFLKNYLIVIILYIGVVFSLSLVLFMRYDVR